MSELRTIEETLRRAAGRRRLDRALRGLWLGFFVAVCAWLALLAAYKLLPLPRELTLWALLLPPLGALAGLVAGAWRRPGLAETARWVEDRERLEQRLSTALEVARDTDGRRQSWTQLILRDAASAAARLDPRRLLPLHLPRAAKWSALGLIALLALGFVPEYRSKDWRQRQQDAAVMRDTGRQLAEVMRREVQQRPPAGEDFRREAEAAAALGDRLAQAKLTRADALKELASVTERLRQEAKDLANDPALRRMEQAARSPSGQSGASAEQQRQMEQLQKQLGRAAENAAALDQLAKGLEQAKQSAAGLPADPAAAAAARQQLAKSLSQLAEQARSLGADLGGLDAALDALSRAQPDQVLKQLDAALDDLSKMREAAQKLAALQQQAQQAGKDLAEQLERGQAAAAAKTLEKMMEQLQSAGLTPEQLQKMLAELEKAGRPAGDYGKVAEMLKAAAGQMQKGEKGDAAKNLAQAAAELRRLQQQAQDMQAMAAALDALNAAQLSIATGQGWSQCLGQGRGTQPRIGKGGRMGVGVGTWTDENSWMFFSELTPLTDYSQLQRPDMDGRGHTDRGEGQLANVAPTRLKGQISPGGQMPSIPLKGVSIKGRSTVEYTEAAQAAQSEAQNALSQDQVPRAYRGAVRDYFDDLK